MRFIFSFIACMLFHLAIAQYTFPEEGFLFSDDEVPRIDIYLAEEDLNQILDPGNLEENIEYPATFIFNSSELQDTVENVGFRLRGNTSRSSAKKSFKVSFNSFERGKKFLGVEKLNLNGEHNDPSIIRSKMGWDIFRLAEVPGSRSNHVALYINEEYKGLYINVEHVDEEFVQKRMTDDNGNLWKCLWPADLNYKSDNPLDYGEPESWGRRAYQLQTNESEFDYTDLAHFIDVLNNYSGEEFKCELERIFDLDNYLRAMVIDVLIGNWDGPIVNKNNFYLYHNPKTDKISYLPYDLDNTLGIDWFNVNWATSDIYTWSDYSGQYRPIYEKIMAVPEYKARYSYYMDRFVKDFFNSTYLTNYLDDKLDLISPYRTEDVYAEQDYGYTYAEFIESYDSGLSGHIEIGLKPYINTRNNVVNSQLDLEAFSPSVQDFWLEWTYEQIRFNGKIYDDGEIIEIIFHYSIQGEAWEQELISSFDQNGFAHEFDVEQYGEMSYYVEMIDDSGAISYYPRCQDGWVQLGYGDTPQIVINEFMASNDSKVQDSAGEYEDWIELFNTGGQGIDLGKLYLSDDPLDRTKWSLPSRFLNPGEYITIWADSDNDQGSYHTNFKLKKDGEFLGLFDEHNNNYAAIDTLTYPVQETDISYARFPNGNGPFDFAPYMTYGYNNESASALANLSNQGVYLYPNPAKDFLYIDSEEEIESYEIYSLDGITHIEGETNEVDIRSLSFGYYLLKIYTSRNELKTLSFVVGN